MSSLKIDAFCPVGIGGTKGIDTTHLKIFVGGLASYHTSKDLFAAFEHFGKIREAVVIPDRFRVRSRCYGFVTFVSSRSVSKVFKQCPIKSKDGIKFTVVLASSNIRPRRAHFNVRHGTSGHKALPSVQEEEDYPHQKHKKVDQSQKVGIYSDPSLFRTANIQPIAPASFHRKRKITRRNQKIRANWPNEDIRKDFTNLMKVNSVNSVNDEFNNKHGKQSHQSWKLVPVNKNNNNDNDNDNENKNVKKQENGYKNYPKSRNEDDGYSVQSVCSKTWTPIVSADEQMNGMNVSVTALGPSSIRSSYCDKSNQSNKECVESPKRRRRTVTGTSPHSPPKMRKSNDGQQSDDNISLFSLFCFQPTSNGNQSVYDYNNYNNSNNAQYNNSYPNDDMNSLKSEFKQKMERGINQKNENIRTQPIQPIYNNEYNNNNNMCNTNNINNMNNMGNVSNMNNMCNMNGMCNMNNMNNNTNYNICDNNIWSEYNHNGLYAQDYQPNFSAPLNMDTSSYCYNVSTPIIVQSGRSRSNGYSVSVSNGANSNSNGKHDVYANTWCNIENMNSTSIQSTNNILSM